MRKTDGELILLWTVPAFVLIWVSAFLLFPGFVSPMSPLMTAEEVAAFYRDPENLPRIRYSMILFNWFCLGMVPVLALIMIQVRRMAHRTPIFSFSFFGCMTGGPTLFLIANLFWLLAAFRPDRPPELIQAFNDLAWVTFTGGVGFLIAQSVVLAIAIFTDHQEKPVFSRGVAYFNLVIAAALLPASFVGLAMDGIMAWDGLLPFWTKNTAIALWIIVMWQVLRRAICQQRQEAGVVA